MKGEGAFREVYFQPFLLTLMPFGIYFMVLTTNMFLFNSLVIESYVEKYDFLYRPYLFKRRLQVS